jgi:hypothetical protein
MGPEVHEIEGPTLTLTPVVEVLDEEYYAGLRNITGPTLTLTPSARLKKMKHTIKYAPGLYIFLDPEIQPVEITYEYSINNLS